jgi:DNA repair photolyase
MDYEQKSVEKGQELSLFGTKEWAAYNENCLLGCSHDCRYCYAKSMAIRFKRKTPGTWKNEVFVPSKIQKVFHKRDGRIMFPSSHDITPAHLDECLAFLKNILGPGNEVLVVSKPHFDCIKRVCDELFAYKDIIMFRFTIGSIESRTLKFWEPNVPDSAERLGSLKYAFEKGFQTSISCEPMLDNNAGDLIAQVSPYVTHSIWLGKANNLLGRLKINGETDPARIQRAKDLLELQSDQNIRQLYSQYKDNPLIRWKGSIKKVVGLKVPTESGLDV